MLKPRLDFGKRVGGLKASLPDEFVTKSQLVDSVGASLVTNDAGDVVFPVLPAGALGDMLYHNGTNWVDSSQTTTSLTYIDYALKLGWIWRDLHRYLYIRRQPPYLEGVYNFTTPNTEPLIIFTDNDFGTLFKIDYLGTLFSNSLTPSTPLMADASKNIVSGAFGTTAGTVAEGNHTHSEFSDIYNQLNTIWYGSTTNDTLTEIFLDGASERYTLPTNTAVSFNIDVLMKNCSSGTTPYYAKYTIKGIVKNESGITAIVYSNVATDFESSSGMDASVTANNYDGYLKLWVKGLADTTLSWQAIGQMNVITCTKDQGFMPKDLQIYNTTYSICRNNISGFPVLVYLSEYGVEYNAYVNDEITPFFTTWINGDGGTIQLPFTLWLDATQDPHFPDGNNTIHIIARNINRPSLLVTFTQTVAAEIHSAPTDYVDYDSNTKTMTYGGSFSVTMTGLESGVLYTFWNGLNQLGSQFTSATPIVTVPSHTSLNPSPNSQAEFTITLRMANGSDGTCFVNNDQSITLTVTT